MFALMLLYAVQTFCVLFMPYVMSNIVENGVRVFDMTYIWQQSAVMFALALVQIVISLVTNKINCNFMAMFAVNLRSTLFEKVNTLSLEQFSSVGTNTLITRTMDDIGWMQETISMIPYVVVSEPIMFIGGIILSLLGDWVLACILLGASLVVLFIVSRMTSSLHGLWQTGDKYADIQNKIIRERLSGIRVIRAFDRENYEHQRAAEATTTMCKAFVRSNTTSGLVNPVASLLLNMATVGIIYLGAVRLQYVPTLKAGDIIATIQYIALIINAILTLSWTFSFAPHVKVSMERIGAVLDMPLDDDGKQSTFDKFDGSVQFENVSFSYFNADIPTLSDVSLNIQPGEIVGIIGGTGSGKTTLIKLLMAFYSCNGKRKIGGYDYQKIGTKSVRDNVSVALQKSMIFEGTLAENVKMGNPSATDEQLAQALEVAQLSKFVEQNEEGVNYKLNQAGSNLSGGQKQRVNIARAILKDASVYVFDDSFSALDYLTESSLRKALNQYLAGKTQIIVTQRAATAMRCDKVYCMDRGRIVGVGTHKQLLANCQVYREIYQSQLGGDAVE